MNGSRGYTQAALQKLETGTYRGRKQKYRTSQEQLEAAPKKVPALEGLTRSPVFDQTHNVDTANSRAIYEKRIQHTPIGRTDMAPKDNDKNYVVKRDRYNKLMRDNRLANDVKKLADVYYNNANQDATVSEDYAYNIGAKSITGGFTKDEFLKTLSRRYNLTAKELNDMALTYHSDRNKAASKNFGQQLEKVSAALPGLGSVGSFVGTLGSGIEGAYNTVVGGLTDDDRFLSDIFRTTKNSQREGAKQNIKSNAGKTAYDIVMGVGDMVVGAAAGSAPAILAGNTANEAQASALERGSSVRKSSVYGGAAGLLDFVTNKVGLEKAKNLAVNSLKSTGIKRALAKNAIAGVGEAGENVIQDIGQSFIDNIINGKNSELVTSYNNKLANGMSESAAFKEVAKEYAVQLGISAATGYGMGSVMQAGSSIIPNVNKIPALTKEAGNKFREMQAQRTANSQRLQDIINGEIPKVTTEAEIQKAQQQQAEATEAISQLEQQIPKADNDLLVENEEGNQNDRNVDQKEQVINIIDNTPDNIYPIQMPGTNGVISLDGPTLPIVLGDNQAISAPVRTAAATAVTKNPTLTRTVESVRAEINDLTNAIENKYAEYTGTPKYKKRKVWKEYEALKEQKAAKEYELRNVTRANNGLVDLSKRDFNSIDEFKNDLKLAGKTIGGKKGRELAQTAITALDSFESTGSQADLKNFIQATIALKNESTDPWVNTLFARIMPTTEDKMPSGIYQAMGNILKRSENAPVSVGDTAPIEVDPNNVESVMDETQNIPQENIASDSSIPESRTQEIPTSDKHAQSRVVTHTGINADIISQKQYDTDPIYKQIADYAAHSNKQTYDAALSNVKKEGTKLLNDYINGAKKIDNDLDVDQAMLLLTNMSQQLSDQRGEAPSNLLANRNLLFSRLREAGTQYGQLIQAFKKWNNTAEGSIINGEKIQQEAVERWKKSNKKKVEFNNKIAKALENMGVDASIRNKKTQPKTHAQIRDGVRNVIEREYGSVEQFFNNDDIEFLTALAEDKSIPIWQITDEIEHKLNYGQWYTLDESTEPKMPQNQRLKNALDALVDREPEPEKEPLTFDEIKDQVRNTLNNEMANAGTSRLYTDLGEFTDEDIDYIANLINEGATKQELADALNTKYATGRFGISEDTQNKVNLLFEEANHFDPNSKEAVEARSLAYKLIADEVVTDASPLEKFESWRYLAMLGNPKTMMRNWIGNKMFGIVTGVSNNLSAALEAGADKAIKAFGGKGIQRTKTFLNPVNDRALIKASAADGDAHRYSDLEGTKYEKGTRDAIKQQKSVFNSKLIQLYEKATDKGISDYNAVKRKYSTSLAGYLKANGLDESIFDADNTYRGLKDISRRRVLTDTERAQMNSLQPYAEALEKARDYAVKEAEYATFHEDNDVAKLLTKFSQDTRNSENPAARALGYMVEGIVPFKKTPANILRSGLEYSPLNLAKSLVDTAKLTWENTGSRKGNLEDTYTKKSKLTGREKEISKLTAAEVLDDWSKTITGSGIVALGYYLANNGVLNSSNKDEKYQDDLEGIQNYSITIGDKTYTLDWAAPAVMPLLVGAEIQKIKERNGLLDKQVYENFDEILGTVNALLDPFFETSMMQGVKNSLEAAADEVKYNDNPGPGILGAVATNTLTGYLTQGIPTLSGQLARTIDNTRRSNDTATDSNFLSGVEKQGRKLMNKIPGLSYLNEEYRDAYGRTQQNGPFENPLGNFAYQTFSPSYIRDINTTLPDKSAREVYYAKGEKGVPQLDSKVFPTWKSKVSESDHKFTPKEMSIYRKSSGEAQYKIREALAKELWFNDLSGPRQAEILKKVNTLVDKIGKEAAGYPQDSKELEIYNNGGVPLLLDSFQEKAIKKQIEANTGISANTKVAKELTEAIKKGNQTVIQQKTQEAKEYVETKKNAEDLGVQAKTYNKISDKAGANAEKVYNAIPELQRFGLGTSSAYYQYADALNVDPNLSSGEFAKTFNAIDADNSKGIKQDELINYFNKNKTSQQQADKMWKMYGDSGWKKLPVLVNGSFVKK